MDKKTQRYLEAEFLRVAPLRPPEDAIFKMQICGPEFSQRTNYLNITAAQLREIERILLPDAIYEVDQ